MRHYHLDSSQNLTVVGASVGSRFNTWQNNFGRAGPWNTHRHHNPDRSGRLRKGTSLWTTSCCCTRNRFLVVSERSAVWLKSILTLMAECDRSKWKQKIHYCDDLWPNSAVFSCEVIATKLCRVQLWDGCLFVVVNIFYLSWIYVWTICASGTVVTTLLLPHTLTSGLIQALRKNIVGSHVALRGNISAPVRVTDLVEVSKDTASLVVSTRKKIFWLGGASFLWMTS